MKTYHSKTQLKNVGVYCIKNTINGKLYIGSSINMYKRFIHHRSNLNIKKHKNSYLQNSVNKNGIENFVFRILCYCEQSKIFEREEFYIKYFDSCNKSKGYNINPLATGGSQFSEESIKKRAKTNKEIYRIRTLDPEFKGYNTKPNKTSFKKGVEVWNKGLKYNSTEHLKVPKTYKDIEKKDKSYKDRSIKVRKESNNIFVYDLNLNYLGEWESSKDLEEWSLTDENNLPIVSRFKTERMGKPVKLLQSANINKCANGITKDYKGLKFFYKPLYQVTDIEKQEELLETPTLERQKEDNQQPSLTRNSLEGSTTNTRILTSNVEDSNGNTSILPLKKKIVLNFNKTKLF